MVKTDNATDPEIQIKAAVWWHGRYLRGEWTPCPLWLSAIEFSGRVDMIGKAMDLSHRRGVAFILLQILYTVYVGCRDRLMAMMAD